VADLSRAAIPLWIGGDYVFGWGSDRIDPSDLNSPSWRATAARIESVTRYYAPDMHRASVTHPRMIKRLVEQAGTVQPGKAKSVIGGALYDSHC